MVGGCFDIVLTFILVAIACRVFVFGLRHAPLVRINMFDVRYACAHSCAFCGLVFGRGDTNPVFAFSTATRIDLDAGSVCSETYRTVYLQARTFDSVNLRNRTYRRRLCIDFPCKYSPET